MNGIPADLPPELRIPLIALIVVAVALLVAGLLVWRATPDSEMPPPNRWTWLAVVCLASVVGPTAFLVARHHHRRTITPADAADSASAPARRGSADVVDSLYGQRHD